MKTLVAVASHADDAEINAGGLMAKWTRAGGRVHILLASNNCSGSLIREGRGDGDSVRLPPDETTAIRYREQEVAAGLIGANVHHLDLCQMHYWDGQSVTSVGHGTMSPPQSLREKPLLLTAHMNREIVSRVADLMVSLQPGLVVTQTPLDLHPEHYATACLVWRAFMARRESLPCVPLRFWTGGSTCPNGMLPAPMDAIEDITEVFQTKLDLCACHRSQMTAKRWELVRRRAREWGERIGVDYAEPFTTASLTDWFAS
jgi:LmbE family N-acetylglucosaminyl deacetylase